MSTSDSMVYLINKYGQDFTLKKITPSSIDLNNPTAAPIVVETTYNIKGYPSKYKDREIDGELIRSDDIRLNVAELTVTPTTNDQILQGSNVWNILDIKRFYVGDEIPLYWIQMRK